MLCKNTLLESIGKHLSEPGGETVQLQWQRDLTGGDINRAALIDDGRRNWFLKYHENASADMFETESGALREIADLGCIRVPRPIATGRSDQVDWLVLEYIEMTGSGSEFQLGEQLAALHTTGFSHYGWRHNNYIGTTPQDNSPEQSWAIFWRDRRISPQLEMAETNGFGGRLLHDGERLLASMENLLSGHEPPASLLHGDLWAGNKSYAHNGEPVIFDPASYYGDRETDIAMTELFGGYSAEFYRGYEERLPLPDGYRQRRDLYNLYHVLNHLNLFGRAYLGRSENMISALLAHTH